MKLKELREANGVTQEELAKVIGVNVRSVNRWEKGQSDIYLQKAIKIARFFEVSLDEFVK
ncbi:helix-turn-helix transcriptional regulator [Streptococcus equinus]|uniref:helix-turn-helix transcriptional regulator n=1 Tax=Streptococcus equinus TaxID=1335 RepID=UPI0008847499|nr:helix-turn-helix transcriptional regulator [Streptococcus equinus]SDQ58375.1 putative transcriptional regulator [Streptococcus equinus]